LFAGADAASDGHTHPAGRELPSIILISQTLGGRASSRIQCAGWRPSRLPTGPRPGLGLWFERSRLRRWTRSARSGGVTRALRARAEGKNGGRTLDDPKLLWLYWGNVPE